MGFSHVDSWGVWGSVWGPVGCERRAGGSRAKKQPRRADQVDSTLSKARPPTAQLPHKVERLTNMASSSLKSINPNAEIMQKGAALFMNINAAKGAPPVLQDQLGTTTATTKSRFFFSLSGRCTA